jgi:hypothetical protein
MEFAKEFCALTTKVGKGIRNPRNQSAKLKLCELRGKNISNNFIVTF